MLEQALLRWVGFGLLLSLLIAGCGSSGSSSSNPQPCALTYWVSTGGNDSSGDGSASAPFLTLDRARLAVAQNPQRGQCTINVNIESGTYALTAPIIFGPSDSGSPRAPVVYQSAPNNSQPVVISGGVPVTNLTCSALNICTAPVSGLPAGTMPRQLYVNGQRAIRARSNYGQAVNLNYIRGSNGYTQIIPQSLTHPELVEAVTATQWKMMRCPVASMTGNFLQMQNPCWDNANTYPSPWNFQLLSWLENAPEFLTQANMWYLDPYSQQLSYYNTASTPPQSVILPVLESLIQVIGTANSPVTNITFQGLQFSYATWLEPNSDNGYVADQSGNILMGNNYAANVIGHQQTVYKTPGNITLQYAQNITFNSDKFIHLGAAALDLDTGSQNNTVQNSIFSDISSAAIEIGGFEPQDMRPNSAQVTSGNVVKNNVISYTGRDYYDSAGILVGFTTGTVITHNTISHTPWSAISIGWGWGLFDQPSFPGLPHAVPNMWGTYNTPTIASNNVISSNKFDSFLEQLWDGGAIYTNGSQGQSFANGLLITLNVAENKRPAAGSNIYYTDGGSQYVTMTQNVSLNDPVGTVDFGPCLTGSSIVPYCATTGVLPYGSDMGGCLPVGNLTYNQNYFLDTVDFFGPQICQNSYIPPYPVNLTFTNNVPTTSAAQVPNSILLQAGAQ
ncbi:MAG TPA: right-handed parallel beta-helix repeat-containing protein [Candidatus Binataceae bacterium]|nr:right-handed parallel beta-helix repeat-containing protein [Candidatus Binataceae bacterium]